MDTHDMAQHVETYREFVFGIRTAALIALAVLALLAFFTT